jgi:hypothetical protein
MVVGYKTATTNKMMWENADHCCQFAALPGFGFCMPDPQGWSAGSSLTQAGVTCD